MACSMEDEDEIMGSNPYQVKLEVRNPSKLDNQKYQFASTTVCLRASACSPQTSMIMW